MSIWIYEDTNIPSAVVKRELDQRTKDHLTEAYYKTSYGFRLVDSSTVNEELMATPNLRTKLRFIAKQALTKRTPFDYDPEADEFFRDPNDDELREFVRAKFKGKDIQHILNAAFSCEFFLTLDRKTILNVVEREWDASRRLMPGLLFVDPKMLNLVICAPQCSICSGMDNTKSKISHERHIEAQRQYAKEDKTFRHWPI
jgi:hypothetical protein